MILSLLLLLQQFTPPPTPVIEPTPVSVSERSLFDQGLRDAGASAQALGGLLGASIADLTTGVDAHLNGEQAFSTGAIQRLPIAVLAYREAEAGKLSLSQPAGNETLGDALLRMLGGDNAAAQSVVAALHGPDAIDAAFHAVPLDGVFVEANDGGYATPDALRTLLREVSTDSLLQSATSNAILNVLANVSDVPGGFRAGLPGRTHLEHLTGNIEGAEVSPATDEIGIAHIPGHVLLIVAMLRDAGGTPVQRQAVLAQVARAAVQGATANEGQ